MKEKKMKKFCLFFLVFFTTTIFTFSNELEFELLSTDFSGIFRSGNTILIYGKHGIINYSNDLGINWKQAFVGVNNDVLKIISVDDKFYALTPEKIYVSKDQGKSWEETSIHWEQNFVDFCTDGNQIFVVTDNEILSIDKELKSDLNLLFQFDTFTKFTEMTVWQKYLFIIDANISIVKFNVLTKAPEDTLFTGFATQKIEKLKVRDSTIFVLLVSNEHSPSIEFDYQFIRHSVLFSEDFGKTWKIFAKDIPLTRDYIIEGNEIHTLSPKILGNSRYFSVSFVKADNQGLFEENDLIEPNTWIPIFNLVENANIFRINSIERVNDSTIVACGNSKTILISRDNGKNWVFTSYFRPIYSLFFNRNINQIVQKGEDTIVVLSYYPPYMFTSFDRGATFRTLGIDTNFRGLLSVFKCPLTPPNGKLGYFTFERDNNQKFTGTIRVVELNFTSNQYAANDFFYKPYESFKWDSVDLVILLDPIYFKERIFVLANLQGKGNSFLSSIIFVLDNNLRLIDTLFSPKAIPKFVPDGNYLYTLSSDSESTFVLRRPSLKSDWEVVASIPQASYNKPNEKVYLELTKVVNNYFIFTKAIIKDSQWKYYLLIFDKLSGRLDSIEVPAPKGLFSFGDTIFVLTEYWLREYTNLPQDTTTFIEYKLPDISGAVINSIFRLENQDYISLVKKYSSLYDAVYEGNFGRLKRKIQEPNAVIEEVRPFLFCFPLYPNPAFSYVDLGLCWDMGFSIDNINFTCFNLNGQKIEVPYSLLTQSAPNCGVIRFSLSDVPPNIYFINVKLQNSEWTVPFVLTK
jgi:hypothetical protein